MNVSESRARSVSVVIPAFNAERFVANAVESVLAQTHAPIECIVVDDGSTDRTAAIATGFGSAVTVLSGPNRGVAAARNRGAAAATGTYLSFLDADDLWVEQRTKRLLEVLEADAGLDAVVSAVRVVDAGLEPIGIHRQSEEIDLASVLLFEVELVSTSSNLLIRREAFGAVGGFDERLSTAADWALTVKLLQSRQLGYVDEPLTLYRRHGSNMSRAVEPMEHDMRMIYDELFAEADSSSQLASIRRSAYARLHRVLAGSYFRASNWRGFARNAALTIAHRPAELGYFIALPLRRRGVR